MTEQITDAHLSRPDVGGNVHAKRAAPKGLLPGSWLSRGVRVEYRDSDGQGQTMSGKLLDTFPVGLVVGSGGYRVLLSWDALILLELRED